MLVIEAGMTFGWHLTVIWTKKIKHLILYLGKSMGIEGQRAWGAGGARKPMSLTKEWGQV